MKAYRFVVEVMALCALLLTTPAWAQTPTGVGVGLGVQSINAKEIRVSGALTLAVFSTKFLCGTIRPEAGDPQFPGGNDLLVPGTYLTAVNIHNPNARPVQFRKKVVVTLPERNKDRGPVSRAVVEGLGSNQGLEVDCQDVLGLLFTPTGQAAPPNLRTAFLKGFVVIEQEIRTLREGNEAPSPFDVPMDVVGVYTLKNVEPPRAAQTAP